MDLDLNFKKHSFTFDSKQIDSTKKNFNLKLLKWALNYIITTTT